jgi:hypothetical protein
MGKVIAFPGQEKQVEEAVATRAETWQRWHEENVMPFIDRTNALAPDMGDEEFWAEVTAMRDELNRWIGGG